ncbi:hypothetical protein THAOC_20038 [Thalassiosira oceanica]|uniref:Uncharacterized protein n=1 Tax=Thalassiosira oceanica TaxID=159749 RepID=K0S3E8_THAOC|nr:hypothetical protein THAOC_20038 [Thalassiosira oceanica]|eukprot:EJK59705.1 hypothetical protein THAOC_20038 [Thalassiosira oceanica]
MSGVPQAKRRLVFGEASDHGSSSDRPGPKPVVNPYKKKTKYQQSLQNERNPYSKKKDESESRVTPNIETALKRSRDVGDDDTTRRRILLRTNSEDEDKEGINYHSDVSKNDEDYDPAYINRCLQYCSRGSKALPVGTLAAYRFVRDNFLVPRDIEDPRFGAYSGTSFEERVLRAYSLGMLETKGDVDKTTLKVCTYCGCERHVRDECPELL